MFNSKAFGKLRRKQLARERVGLGLVVVVGGLMNARGGLAGLSFPEEA